jgi:hypothetical protein
VGVCIQVDNLFLFDSPFKLRLALFAVQFSKLSAICLQNSNTKNLSAYIIIFLLIKLRKITGLRVKEEMVM